MARRGAWLTGGLLAVGVGLMWAERAGPPNERPPRLDLRT